MNIPRPEYPRPNLRRGENSWLNLNGTWYFESDRGDSGGARELYKREQYAKEITVPFVPESEASGLRDTDFMRRVWYCRTFELPAHFALAHGRVLLHCGAVNYEAQVWLNGDFAGQHRGGYTPFTLDITELLHPGENRINLTACSDVRSPLQPSGKQSERFHSFGCFYTRCTGIWQTVWLEYVPETYIQNIKLLPDVKGEKLDVQVTLSGNAPVHAAVTFETQWIGEGWGESTGGVATFSVPVPDPVLWGPGEPNLYDIEILAGEDRVTSYFGMRSVEVDGYRLRINGKSVFQRLVLDQGYYPEGIYTASGRADFARDIRLSMEAGFNGARMHMKIFEPGFIYEADHAGYLLWGEYPNWGLDISRPGALDVMLPEWMEAVVRDVNSPSIIGWCPFNESFPGENTSIYDTVYRITKLYDPTRPVLDTSGYVHGGVGDLYDVHDYEQDPAVFAAHYAPLSIGEKPYHNEIGGNPGYDGQRPYFVSEFGGAFYDLDARSLPGTQDSGAVWGYGEAPQTRAALTDRMIDLCRVLMENHRVCGFCYTQFTDVEQEMNGVYTYDRRAKMEISRVREALGAPAAIEEEA